MLSDLNTTFFIVFALLNMSVLSLLLIGRMRRLQRQLQGLDDHHRQLRQHNGQLGQELMSRLQELESQVERMSRKQAELKAKPHQDSNFTHANKLLDLGIDSAQLSQSLGLSDEEARLISLLHDKQNGREGAGPLSDAA